MISHSSIVWRLSAGARRIWVRLISVSMLLTNCGTCCSLNGSRFSLNDVGSLENLLAAAAAVIATQVTSVVLGAGIHTEHSPSSPKTAVALLA